MMPLSTIPLLPLVVGLPLLGAIAAVMLSTHHWRVVSSLLIAVAQFATVIALAAVHSTEGSQYYTLGGWNPPLGIALVADGLTIALLLITALLTLVISIYSAHYFANSANSQRFWPLWWLLVAGLNAAFIAADAFNIYVALEMIGLAAVALVALSGTRTALSAALRYALVGLLGSLCYLLGVAFLYRTYGTLDLAQLAAQVQPEPLTWAALCLITVGLLLKTALLPLHFWLPPAHASAPVPVSAVLSALVVKASFYLLIRFWLDVLAPAVTHTAANFLGLLGAIAIIWGCIEAFKAKRLKLLVAYSTVAQLGYLFLLFPLALAGGFTSSSGSALAAVAYFIIAHALAKAAMFLAAGNIAASYGHDDIDKLQGLVRFQPAALATFAIAGVSLIGLPPSGGFIAKWLLLNTAISNGQWWWVLVMLGGGLLAAIYIGRVLNIAFNQTDIPGFKMRGAGDSATTDSPSTSSAYVNSTSMTACALALAVLAVLLGFNAGWILEMLGNGMGTAPDLTGASA